MRIHDRAAQMNAQRPRRHVPEKREAKHPHANSDVRCILASLPENWRHAGSLVPIRLIPSARDHDSGRFFRCTATSDNRNFAMSLMSFLGTGAESEKRIVPLSALQVASSSLK